MFRSSLEALVMRVAGIVIWLAVTILFARLLPQSEVGALFYLVNIAILGGTVATVGHDVTMLRFGSGMWRDGDRLGLVRLYGGAQVMPILAGLVLLVALLLLRAFGPDTPVTTTLPLIVLVVASVALSASLAISRDLLRSVEKLRIALMGETIVRTVGFALIAGLLILLGVKSATILFAGYVLALILANLLQHRAIQAQIGRLALHWPQKVHVKSAVGTWIGMSSGILMMRLPGLVVGIKSGMSEAALFFAADRVAQMTNLLTSAIRTATGPNLARASEQELPEEVARASALIFFAGLIGGTGVILLGSLLLLALGGDYFSAFPALLFLLSGYLASSVMGPCPLILYMRGRERIGASVDSGSMLTMALFLIGVSAAESAVEVAQIFAAGMWLLYLCSWLATRLTLGVTAGVFSIRRRHLREVAQEMKQMLVKFTSRFSNMRD